MTTEPRTEAGQSAVTAWHLPPRIAAAIEAEAARLALEDVAERVRALPTFDDGAISRSTDVVLPCVDRAAVLALLSKEEGA